MKEAKLNADHSFESHASAAGTAENPLREFAKPLFRGNGDTDYPCGHRGSVMAAKMGPTQHIIVDTAICSACGAENEFPPGWRA